MTPVFVCSDRYGGTYSGGAWWAIANADMPMGDGTRLDWVLRDGEGPWSGDVAVAGFWCNPPEWIAVGDTPDQACEALIDYALRGELLARGPCHKAWRGLEYERNFSNDFDWYAELPHQIRFLSVATLQNQHAPGSSPDAWIALVLNRTTEKIAKLLNSDEDDILWLLTEEKDTYRAGPTPMDSIRNLVDALVRRKGFP